MPKSKYGNKTAKELDNYIKNYKIPIGRTKTGLAAPYHDFKRNRDTMKEMRLKESDSFFHCKANYEAASRGAYGALAAGMLSVGREISDAILKGDNFSQILSDIKADERGIRGGSLKKSLRETCPTHHTKYK